MLNVAKLLLKTGKKRRKGGARAVTWLQPFCEKMKNRMLLGGIIGAVIMLVIVGAVWGITSARAKTAEPETDESSVAAAGPQLMIEANGKTFVFENTDGKSLNELLEEAGITIEEGDAIVFDPNQAISGERINVRIVHEEEDPMMLNVDGVEVELGEAEGKTLVQLLNENALSVQEDEILALDGKQLLSGNLAVKILSKTPVTIAMTDKETGEAVEYHLIMMGGTVEDALKAAKLTLGENQEINMDLSAPLEYGMQIVIADKVEEESSEAEETYYETYWEPESSTTSTESSTTTQGSGTSSQESSTAAQESSAPAEESSEEITVVSVEVYEDCDGSGHGVKIITYSDGSQEEVPY